MSVWPPVIILCWIAVVIGIAIAEAKDVLLCLAGMAALCALLWWGGFFDPLLR
jgi:hypothetical protein